MTRILTSLLILALLACPSFASEDDEYFIKEIREEYQKLENFSCTGQLKITHLVYDFIAHEHLIYFTIKLKKPNHFMIHWKSGELKDGAFHIEGAIWSEGNKFFYYQKDLEGYFSLTEPEQAFSIASGASFGITYTIPSLFFESYFKKDWLGSLKEPKLHKNKDNSLQVSSVVIDTDFIRNNKIDFLNDQRIIKRYWRKTTQPDSNKKRVEELKEQRKEIKEGKKKYEKIFNELDDSENKVTVESILRVFDERIEKMSILPENKHMVHSVENVIFENISTKTLHLEDIKFNIPPGVEFKGRKFQQTSTEAE